MTSLQFLYVVKLMSVAGCACLDLNQMTAFLIASRVWCNTVTRSRSLMSVHTCWARLGNTWLIAVATQSSSMSSNTMLSWTHLLCSTNQGLVSCKSYRQYP